MRFISVIGKFTGDANNLAARNAGNLLCPGRGVSFHIVIAGCTVNVVQATFQTVVCQRNGHVGLTAGVGRLEPVALHQTQITDGVQAHHDLTKGNDSFCHGNSPSVR